ncbi:MAG: hypothetical protein PUE95_12430 [Lachnospiraceae bacterium]|nr:hypothetical protein [Lachnospiraceae bacterium]
MSKVFRIIKADFKGTASVYLRSLMMVAFFFVYFKIFCGGTFINLGMLLIWSQAIMIYMLSMQDISNSIPTYIGMGCTRKSVSIAIWIRWFLLLLISIGIYALVCAALYPEMLTIKLFVTQIATFLMMLGLNSVIVVIGDANRWIGVIFGCLFAAGIGIGTVAFTKTTESAGIIAQKIGSVSDGIFSTSFFIAVVVLLFGIVFHTIRLKKYSVR